MRLSNLVRSVEDIALNTAHTVGDKASKFKHETALELRARQIAREERLAERQAAKLLKLSASERLQMERDQRRIEMRAAEILNARKQ